MTCNRVAPVTFAFAFALVSVYIVSALRIRLVCSLCQHRSLSLSLSPILTVCMIFLLLFLLLFLWLFSRISPTLQATFDTPFLALCTPLCVRSCACGYSYRSICRLYFLDLGQRVCENRKFCFGLECAMPCLVPSPSPRLLLPPSSAGKMCRIRCCCC